MCFNLLTFFCFHIVLLIAEPLRFVNILLVTVYNAEVIILPHEVSTLAVDWSIGQGPKFRIWGDNNLNYVPDDALWLLGHVLP